jgi:hypothetical protein
MHDNIVELSLTFNAPLDIAWKKIVEWNSQGDWMLQTVVWAEESSEPLSQEIFAFTGPLYRIYPRCAFLGVLDHMKVTHWNPPYRCDVAHIGRIIRGSGTFQLRSEGNNLTHFYWSETIEAPRLLFFFIRPFFTAGVWLSLRRLARVLDGAGALGE